MSRRSTTQRLDTARREATLARVDLCLAPRSRRPAPVTRHVRWEPGVGRHRAGGARRDRRRRTQDDTRVTGERLLAGSARVRDPSLAIGDVHGAGLFSGRELAAGQLDDPTYLARMATLRTELAIASLAVASGDKVIAKLRALPETWAMATPDGRAELPKRNLLDDRGFFTCLARSVGYQQPGSGLADGRNASGSQAHKPGRVRRTNDRFALNTSAPDFQGPPFLLHAGLGKTAPPQDVVVVFPRHPTGHGVGWRGRIRTFDLLIQSQAPYRLATRHCERRILAHGRAPGRWDPDRSLVPCRPCRRRGPASSGRLENAAAMHGRSGGMRPGVARPHREPAAMGRRSSMPSSRGSVISRSVADGGRRCSPCRSSRSWGSSSRC